MNVICRIKSQMLRDYLRSLFANEGGALKIDRTTDVGKFICSLTKVSDIPQPQEITDECVQFILPVTSHLPELFRKFNYLDANDQKRIEDHIASYFNLDFGMFYLYGKQLGFQEKEVILNFIIDRKLDSQIGDVETLKKRKYREYEKNTKKIHHRLQMRAHTMKKAFVKAFESINSINYE